MYSWPSQTHRASQHRSSNLMFPSPTSMQQLSLPAHQVLLHYFPRLPLQTFSSILSLKTMFLTMQSSSEALAAFEKLSLEQAWLSGCKSITFNGHPNQYPLSTRNFVRVIQLYRADRLHWEACTEVAGGSGSCSDRCKSN